MGTSELPFVVLRREREERPVSKWAHSGRHLAHSVSSCARSSDDKLYTATQRSKSPSNRRSDALHKINDDLCRRVLVSLVHLLSEPRVRRQ